MDTISTTEKIERLEKELAQLKEKERKEKEEAQKKAEAERDADLLAIMDSIKAFNKKHGESIALSTASNSKSAQGLYDILFPWFGD